MYFQKGHQISGIELFISGFLLFLLPFVAFAEVGFFALLPNPAGDDTAGEYIEIRNTGCTTVDISGYRLYDASLKSYTIPSGTTISSHTNMIFPYSQTKIALNNSGIETITLTSTTGTIVDTDTYSGTQRDSVVIYLSPVDEDCSTISPVENNTGTTESGSGASQTSGGQGTGVTSTGTSSTGSQDNSFAGDTTSIGSGVENQTPIDPPFSGGLDTTSTGTTNTGATESGSGASDTSEPVQSGALEGQGTGVSNTGSTSTVIIQDSNTPTLEQSNTGILFPDIIPTRQEPTNATLSGNTWDCGTNQPCRINVTFDPIFTGSFLSRDYLCEVITATGNLTTCNPNTLYFSTGASFSLRLTSKLDPSQSMTVIWGVRFQVVPSESATGVTNTGAIEQNPPSSLGQGGTGTTNTGVTSSLSDSTSSGVIFPDIVPTFQNYTNTTNSGDTLTCVTSPCRINFTLDPIFTGSFLSRDYICEVTYGTGIYDCNPPQLYPIASGSILITLTHKTSGQKNTKLLTIVQNIPVPAIIAEGASPTINTQQVDINPPIAILEFDGKRYPYYEQINDHEFNCYVSTCSVNLTAERSYDREGGAVRFLWYYGPNDIRISRDPGGRKYGIGSHEIWLRVIDIAGNISEIRYRIHVLGPKSEEEKKKIRIKKEIDTETKSEKSGVSETLGGQKKNKKIQKIDFFDPPTISLQSSKFIETDDGYICRTTTKTCSLNLTLSGIERGISYTWEYDDGDIITSKNPRSKNLSIGSHNITVVASYSGSTDILWTDAIVATVERSIIAKKPKKIKTPKTDTKKESQGVPIIVMEPDKILEDDIPYTTIALVGGILPLVLLRRFFTGMV